MKKHCGRTDERGVVFLILGGRCLQGCLLALAGEASNAVKLITTSLAEWRAMGASLFGLLRSPKRTNNGHRATSVRCQQPTSYTTSRIGRGIVLV